MLWPGSVFRGQVGNRRGDAEDDCKDLDDNGYDDGDKKQGGEINHGPAQTRAPTTST